MASSWSATSTPRAQAACQTWRCGGARAYQGAVHESGPLASSELTHHARPASPLGHARRTAPGALRGAVGRGGKRRLRRQRTVRFRAGRSHVLSACSWLTHRALAPSYTSSRGATACFKLSLSDGVRRVVGFEYRPLPELSWDTTAGTKVALTNPYVRRGALLLTPQTLTLLGGGVARLEGARRAAVERWNAPPGSAALEAARLRRAAAAAGLAPPAGPPGRAQAASAAAWAQESGAAATAAAAPNEHPRNTSHAHAPPPAHAPAHDAAAAMCDSEDDDVPLRVKQNTLLGRAPSAAPLGNHAAHAQAPARPAAYANGGGALAAASAAVSRYPAPDVAMEDSLESLFPQLHAPPAAPRMQPASGELQPQRQPPPAAPPEQAARAVVPPSAAAALSTGGAALAAARSSPSPAFLPASALMRPQGCAGGSVGSPACGAWARLSSSPWTYLSVALAHLSDGAVAGPLRVSVHGYITHLLSFAHEGRTEYELRVRVEDGSASVCACVDSTLVAAALGGVAPAELQARALNDPALRARVGAFQSGLAHSSGLLLLELCAGREARLLSLPAGEQEPPGRVADQVRLLLARLQRNANAGI